MTKDTPAPTPTAPGAAMTEDREREIRGQWDHLVETLDEAGMTPGLWSTYTHELLAEVTRLRSQAREVERVRAVLEDYEAWEADVILAADWSESTPRVTQAQWDRLVEIQARRNVVLGRFLAPQPAPTGSET